MLYEMVSHVWIGIDPGLMGCVAVIDESDDVVFHDTPTFKVEGATKTTNRVNLPAYAAIFRQYVGRVVLCAIEDVHAFPKQGVVSSFNFGRVTGNAEMGLACFEIPFVYIKPPTWKAVMCRDMGKDKEASILRFGQLYPQFADMVIKKDGRAEAGLLATYVKHHYRLAVPTYVEPKAKASRGEKARQANKALVVGSSMFNDEYSEAAIDNLESLGRR